MNRNLATVSASLFAPSLAAVLLLSAAPAVAQSTSQSTGQAEAQRRLNFLNSVSGDLSWLCVMKPIGRAGPDVHVGMSVGLLPGQGAFATTISTATLGNRTYSATYRLVGQAHAHADGRATLNLDQSRMVRADALPDGLSWSDTSSVRLSFEIVPDAVTSGRYRYMLRGRQSDDMGGSTINCGVRSGG